MFICGELHYFRVPKPLWGDRLLKLKRSGANCISTYIPWNWHQPVEDVVLFRDDYKEDYVPSYYSRDLRSFLELVNSMGLKAIVRPGPYICSEWDGGGHPSWLYAKTRKLRSLDPVYMQYAKKWYKAVAEVLKPFIDRGVVEAVQVENEYFWGNEPLISELADHVKALLNPPIVFTNEDPYVSSVPNTIDEYPSPWSLERFDEKVKNYIQSQPGSFKMFAELMGGWFSSIKVGAYPTNRLAIPAEWTEMLLKTALGLGLNNFNIYMFHGGSNPGYYTGKYITSSYDYDASIREWGELSDRYYGFKRVFLFLRSFEDLLESSKPSTEEFRALSSCSDIFTRSGARGSLVVLRNNSDSPCYQQLFYAGCLIPSRGTIRIPPRYTKVLVLNYPLKGHELVLSYTTGEPLLKAEINDRVVLVIYGDRGEATETSILLKHRVTSIEHYGSAYAEINGQEVLVEAIHGVGESIVSLKIEQGSSLYLVFTDKHRASRTWNLDEDGVLLLLSNVYYVRDSTRDNNDLVVTLELNNRSCGPLTIITSKDLGGYIEIENVKVPATKLADTVYMTYIPSMFCIEHNKLVVDVRDTSLAEDPLFHHLKKINPGKPLEEAGFYKNGLYVYKIKFNLEKSTLQKLSNKKLAIIGFNDYAAASLNGSFLGAGYHTLEAEADDYLCVGDNELVLIIESTGHPNDGLLYVPNGLYGGIYVGKIGEHRLENWRKIEFKLPTGPQFDYAEFIKNPHVVKQVLKTAKEAVSVESIVLDSPGIYVAEFYIEKDNLHYIFDPGDAFYNNYYYKIFLFVNDQYLGPVVGPVEITQYLRKGVNRIALFIDWGVIVPSIRVYEHRIEGDWFVQDKTYGIVSGWQIDFPATLGTKELPVFLGGYVGKVLWTRFQIEYDRDPSPYNPVKLRLEGHGFRAMVYVNGNFIGRITDDSPVKELYVPEPALKRGLNEVVLLLLITSNNAVLSSIRLEEYYVHNKAELRIRFTA